MKEQENIKGEIYIIKNNINNKVYVGQTIHGYKKRFCGHKHESKSIDRPLYRAFRKYGIDNFYIELLEDNIPYDKLDEREVFWINYYDCVNPKGYNISYGGKAYRTEEERTRMSELVKGENNPMFGKKGELNPFYGHHHTDENKDILSKKAKERYDNLSEEEKELNNKRLDEARIKMLEMYGGGFKNHNHTETTKNKISKTLKGRKLSEETKSKMSENHPRKKKVVMIDKNNKEAVKIFNSMTLACEYLIDNKIHENPKSGQISDVCLKKRKTAYGFVWVYYEDYISGNYDLHFKEKSKPKKVKCIDTKRVYNSASSASKDTGCTANGIIQCCKGKYKSTSDKNGNKLKWEYVDD